MIDDADLHRRRTLRRLLWGGSLLALVGFVLAVGSAVRVASPATFHVVVDADQLDDRATDGTQPAHETISVTCAPPLAGPGSRLQVVGDDQVFYDDEDRLENAGSYAGEEDAVPHLCDQSRVARLGRLGLSGLVGVVLLLAGALCLVRREGLVGSRSVRRAESPKAEPSGD